MNEEKIRNQVVNSDDYPFTFGAMVGFLLGLGAIAEVLSQLFKL